MKSSDIRQEDFEAWLRKHRDEEIVGQPNFNDCCPIACWLRSGPLPNACVAAESVTVFWQEPMYGQLVSKYECELPNWVISFIEQVDQFTAPIEAQQALAILNGTFEWPTLPAEPTS